MAEVTVQRGSDVAEETAYYLDFLERRLGALEQTASSWADLSSEEKNDILSEWSIVEDRTRTLQRLVRRAVSRQPIGAVITNCKDA